MCRLLAGFALLALLGVGVLFLGPRGHSCTVRRDQIHERAVAEYEAEIAQTPKAFRAAFNLGKLLMRARPEEARTRFRESVDWNPEFGTGYLYLAKTLLDTGDLEEAEEAAKQGLAKNPEPKTAPLGHYILADIYSRRGRREEAARQVAAARKLEQGR